MSGVSRIRRQQMIREVEGYLELVVLFGEVAEPSRAHRDRIVERALSLLERICDGGSEWVQALYLKGESLKILERFGEALEVYRKAAELDPTNLHVWLSLGWCYKRTNRLDLAIEALEEALAIEPGQAIVHYNLACYWSLAGNRRHALEYLHHALQLDPDYRDKLDSEHDFDPIRNDPGFQSLNSVIV